MDDQKGWRLDPTRRWKQRWWDGAAWTEHVRTGDDSGRDPVGAMAAGVSRVDPATALAAIRIEARASTKSLARSSARGDPRTHPRAR